MQTINPIKLSFKVLDLKIEVNFLEEKSIQEGKASAAANHWLVQINETDHKKFINWCKLQILGNWVLKVEIC